MCKGGCEIGVMICILATVLVNLRVRARERGKKDLASSIYMALLICTRKLPKITRRRQTAAITAVKYAAVSAAVFSF